jgi:hypothetical protein
LSDLDNEALWKRVDRAIAHANSRRETISELNRLLRKWNVGAPADYISAASRIRQEWLTVEELGAFCRNHKKDKPRQVEPPLVAVEFRGKTCMLDGTNRINAWIRDGDTATHEIIIVCESGNDG